MNFALRPMAEDENFQALFDDPDSPVAKAILALQNDVNNESITADDLAKKRARLNGMRQVREIVMRAHEAQINAERAALAEVEISKQNRGRISLPWLRSFNPTRFGNPLGRPNGTR